MMENEGDASSRLVSLSLSHFHLPHLHHNSRATTLFAPGPPTQTLWGCWVEAVESKQVATSCIGKIALSWGPKSETLALSFQHHFLWIWKSLLVRASKMSVYYMRVIHLKSRRAQAVTTAHSHSHLMPLTQGHICQRISHQVPWQWLTCLFRVEFRLNCKIPDIKNIYMVLNPEIYPTIIQQQLLSN